MNSLIQFKKISILPFLIALMLVAFAQNTRAVSPPPDGGYPGGNTAEGQSALLSLTSGGFNTAVGYFSLRSDTTGQFNTALGVGTLLANTADENTATGAAALLSNTTGADNTANGASALFSNTTGGHNTAFGLQALLRNTNGGDNTATGLNALLNNITANDNTATGSEALTNNTTGTSNTADGRLALAGNTIGNDNTALGSGAGAGVTSGSGNICIGALVSGAAGENNTIRIGDNLPHGEGQSACYLGGIVGQNVDPGSASNVYVDINGKLGNFFSSQRFKRDVKSMDNASEAILALKPVSFHYKNDAKNTPCYGLIAEDVAKINPDLVIRDRDGESYTVRYEQINAMLLNEFLKEHKAFIEEQHKVETLEATVAGLIATAKEQAAQIQKVSAQLEAGRLAPQVVNNNPAVQESTSTNNDNENNDNSN